MLPSLSMFPSAMFAAIASAGTRSVQLILHVSFCRQSSWTGPQATVAPPWLGMYALTKHCNRAQPPTLHTCGHATPAMTKECSASNTVHESFREQTSVAYSFDIGITTFGCLVSAAKR